MDLEEANFILNQLSISEPCINSYTYIGVEQVDEAVDVINKELISREQRIKQLEEELEKYRSIAMGSSKRKDSIRCDKKVKSSLLTLNMNKGELAAV